MKFIQNITPGFVLLLMLLTVFTTAIAQDQSKTERTLNTQNGYIDGEYKPYEVLDTRIDNMKYWRKAAALGLTPVAPQIDVPLGTYKSSKIHALTVVRDDSPDVAVTEENSTQSENSVFVNPNNPDHVLQSNNSTTNPTSTLFGANAFFSYDFGQTWDGQIQGAGGQNSGDPTTAIGLNGRQYVGYISATGGMGVSYSDDGINWTAKTGSAASSLDKNHLTIDNSSSSAYEGNVYNAWVAFAGTNNNEIEFNRSTNDGDSWSTPISISNAVNAGGHNQGVNLQTGPNGEVYAVWAIYDSWPQDENAIGFARSYNGGLSFQPATRIIDDIKGIRSSNFPKNQRVNSFPVMAVDCSDGPNSGNIYVVWTNRGVPGVNSGSDRDIYLIKSIDDGDTWSEPIRVNQDEQNQGHIHYFPWITCDPTNGSLSVIFYDDRNVGGDECETFCANSIDGGLTWEDFRVSDVSFTPSPIPGLAGDYMGDYLGISAHSGKVYPVWCDNRDGVVMTYTSPYELNPLQAPMDLTAELTFETGEVVLDWQFETVQGFQYFKIYRDDFEIGTTTDLTFADNLPDYGVYNYLVTAIHDDGESFGSEASVQWGDGHVVVDPEEIVENILPNTTSSRFITVENVGELDLIYEMSAITDPMDGGGKDYCIPTSNCTQGDGIFDFAMADISNMDNGCSPSGYGDFTSMSTQVEPGETYEVTLGSDYSNQYVSIWIDFDKNATFDEDELLLEDLLLPSAGIHYTEITIPLGVPTGNTRMRVKGIWNNPSSIDPCANANYGETEDYTIIVPGWMLMERLVDTLAPGNTNTAEIFFDSNELENGPYYGIIRVECNDPDLPLLEVPVTLNVGDLLPLALQVVADPSTICVGESTQLQALPTGGTGTYTYEWTSNPAGFTSTDQDPIFSPEENTTYFVEVNDGENIISGQTSVVVNQLPETPDMPLGEASLCWGEYLTVYSTNGSTGSFSYQWTLSPTTAGTIAGNGMTATVTWNEEFTGMADVMVGGINDCGEGEMSEALMIEMNELPTVDLGEDFSICANEVVMLDAGNPGASYLWSTGETTQTIEVDTTGIGIGTAEIWVEVIDAATCANSDTIMIAFDDCTGTTELEEAWSVNVSPNPSNGRFVIEIQSKTDSPIDLEIFNMVGAVVYSEASVYTNQSMNKTVNLQSYPEGIYFLSIKGDGISMIKKIVLQR
jgi:hypothetical protein